MNATEAGIGKSAAQEAWTGARCQACDTALRHTFVDLGMSPLCESFLPAEKLNQMEPFFPLHVYVCETCFLVQLEEYVSPADIFEEYAYFSSFSDSWVAHAKTYVDAVTQRFSLGQNSKVVEIASNDGYLLQHFVARGVPCLGVEPAANVAEKAKERGIPTIVRFFGDDSAPDIAAEHGHADLIVGNNVLAHVPDLKGFVKGLKILLKPDGVITMEFPHLLRLMQENQFDTIYHEHFSYLSILAVRRVFSDHGLTLFDVEELPSHGGSLRIFARHAEDEAKAVTERVDRLLQMELDAKLDDLAAYTAFEEQVKETKRAILDFLIDAKRAGKTIAGYGAPGKGNTLLNYCGIRDDFLDYVVDRNPYKHGKFTPGTHIPIFPPERIGETKPDYVFILPWNLEKEITTQLAHIRDWGGKFVLPIPHVRVVD